jgi:hypothetical protein
MASRAGTECVDVERLGCDEPQPSHAGEEWLIDQVRWMLHHELGGVPEKLDAGQCQNLVDRRGGHVDRLVRHRGWRRWRSRPDRQGSGDESVLHLVHGLVVGGAVGLGSSDQPADRCRRVDPLHTVAQRARPSRADERVVASGGAGRASPDQREHVAPHIEERQHVVAAGGVGHRHHDRLVTEIKPQDRVQRVEVDLDLGGHVGHLSFDCHVRPGWPRQAHKWSSVTTICSTGARRKCVRSPRQCDPAGGDDQSRWSRPVRRVGGLRRI